MIGAMGAMSELPAGQTIKLVPGVTYSLLAMVKEKHSLRAITNRAQRMGVAITSARDNVPASEFGVGAPPDGYRLVHAIGASSAPATLPWSAPGFFAAFDKSTVVKAWSSAAPFVGAAKPWDAPPMPQFTGRATIIPAQPPGKQGPSYPVPVGTPIQHVGQLFPGPKPSRPCPSGYEWVLQTTTNGSGWSCVPSSAVGSGALYAKNFTPPDVSGQPPTSHPGCYYIVHAAGPNGNPPAWTQYICEG
jgi:hypothetical protein